MQQRKRDKQLTQDCGGLESPTVESASRLETQGGIDAAAWVWRQSGGRILFYQGPHAVFC